MIGRRSVIGGLMVGPLLSGMGLGQDANDGAMAMRVRVVFGKQSFTATLEDNASAREFAAMLPLELTISDFGGNEKIAELVRGPVPDARAGDLCYYVPWGNLAFFHGSYESTGDLVRLGRLDDGVEPLLVRGEFPVRIGGL
jgi:hypothetical protein